MNISIVYDKNQPYTTGIYCKAALIELGHNVRHYDRKERIYRPCDLVLKIDDGEFNGFNTMPWHKTALWAIDTHVNMDRLCDIASKADFVFASMKDGVELFEQCGIQSSWIPLAGFPENTPHFENYEYDISFIGGTGTEKRRQLEKVVKGLSERVFFGAAKREEISEIYSKSLIGINSHIGYEINMRTFEVPVNGALLLNDRRDGNGMEQLFEAGVEYLEYEDEDSMIETIKRALFDPDGYTHIRQAGYNRVIKEHTYVHRMKSLLDAIGVES